MEFRRRGDDDPLLWYLEEHMVLVKLFSHYFDFHVVQTAERVYVIVM